MSQVSNLFRLQQVDSQLDRIHSRLAEIQHILETDTKLQEANKRKDQAHKTLLAAEKAVKASEFEVDDQNLKIKQNESSLYSGKVQNPKELQDLQNESSALKRYLVVLEDRLLEAMIALEEAQEDFADAENNFVNVKAQVSGQSKHLSDEQEELNKDIENLMAQRQAIIGPIDDSMRSLYDQLRAQRGGLAVTSFSDKACDACGAILTPATQQAARSPSQIARCPSCNRILYGN